jgi:tripartite-type tricarboxylate transporter receptor subunit TctC
VAQAPADGYTLLLGTSAGMLINPLLNSKLPYDAFRDFSPVSRTNINPQALVAHIPLPAKRSPALPDVPTIAEAGVPGYEYTTWYGIFGPRGLQKSVVTQLNDAVVKALALPDVYQRLMIQGAEPSPSSPEELTRYMREEWARWAKLIKAANIKVE